jgi:lysophospholipase L1-like esterase
MRLRVSLLFALLAVALLAVPGAPGANAGGSKATYYLSLGDSLAQGFQPIGGPASRRAPPGYNQGYADQLFKLVRGDYTQLREVKLGCGGESTVTFRTGALCQYPNGSQLQEAIAFLQANRGKVAFVTINLGANDILSRGPVDGVNDVLANLPTIVGTLKAVAGDVPIIGMNYYEPRIATAWFQTGSVTAVQAVAGQAALLNAAVLGAIYAFFGVPVADVQSAFSLTDVTLVGGVPRNVLQVCAWTWMCAGEPHGPDIHANDEGYGVIARAFLPHL